MSINRSFKDIDQMKEFKNFIEVNHNTNEKADQIDKANVKTSIILSDAQIIETEVYEKLHWGVVASTNQKVKNNIAKALRNKNYEFKKQKKENINSIKEAIDNVRGYRKLENQLHNDTMLMKKNEKNIEVGKTGLKHAQMQTEKQQKKFSGETERLENKIKEGAEIFKNIENEMDAFNKRFNEKKPVHQVKDIEEKLYYKNKTDNINLTKDTETKIENLLDDLEGNINTKSSNAYLVDQTGYSPTRYLKQADEMIEAYSRLNVADRQKYYTYKSRLDNIKSENKIDGGYSE